jgi:hypothetical protein
MSTLHLQDDNVKDEFDWDQSEDHSLVHKIIDCIKNNADRLVEPR